MGVWSHKILGNDTSCEVRERFIELYNQGLDCAEIKKTVISEQEENLEFDPNNIWLGLALICWECKCLDQDLLSRVTEIIKNGTDISFNKELDADTEFLALREKELLTFLEKIKVEKIKARKRVKPPKIHEFHIKPGDIIEVKLNKDHSILILIVFSMHTKNRGELKYVNLKGNLDTYLMDLRIPRLKELGPEWGQIMYKAQAYSLDYDKLTKEHFINILDTSFNVKANINSIDFTKMTFDCNWHVVDYKNPQTLFDLLKTRENIDSGFSGLNLTLKEIISSINE